MQTLLLIHTSLNGADSLSSSLADEYVQSWLSERPGARVITRDLADDPVPHLTAERFSALLSDTDTRDAKQQAIVDHADELVAELQAADEIVLALPMHNFGIPSTLKAYFDHVARSGVTFRYTEKGPVGLLSGKRALVFATRGGTYVGTPLDTQTDYVKNFMSFLGITETEFVYAEGTAMGEEMLDAAITGARRRIGELTAGAV